MSMSYVVNRNIARRFVDWAVGNNGVLLAAFCFSADGFSFRVDGACPFSNEELARVLRAAAEAIEEEDPETSGGNDASA